MWVTTPVCTVVPATVRLRAMRRSPLPMMSTPPGALMRMLSSASLAMPNSRVVLVPRSDQYLSQARSPFAMVPLGHSMPWVVAAPTLGRISLLKTV